MVKWWKDTRGRPQTQCFRQLRVVDRGQDADLKLLPDVGESSHVAPEVAKW